MRALFDDGGKRVDEASPSMPVQVCKFSTKESYDALLLLLSKIKNS